MSAQNKLNRIRKIRQFAVLSALLVSSLASGSQATTASSKYARAAFKSVRAVNLTYPLFMVEGTPPHYRKWSPVEGNKILSQIFTTGFEAVTLNVDPTPLLAEKNGVAAHAPEFTSIIKEILGAHLSVIFNIEPQPLPENRDEKSNDDAENSKSAAGTQSSFSTEQYVQLVSEIARYLSRYEPGQVSLEIGLPAATENTKESRLLAQRLFETARQAAPKMTLMIEANENSISAALKDLQPSKYDSNTLFSFRYFAPVVFTKQGEQGTNTYRHYVQRMPYPPERSNFHDQMNQFRTALNDDTTMGTEERKKVMRAGVDKLSTYYSTPEDFKFMQAQFKQLSEWAMRNGVVADRILIGAFGAEKSSYEHPGVDPDDRARWILTVRSLADRFGFRWAVWQVGTPSCSITFSDKTDGRLDPRILRSLGLR